LTEIGRPALDTVTKATASSDPEVRHRAEAIAALIENRCYPELVLRGHTDAVWCVCVSADGKRVLTGSADKSLRLWDADTGKQLRVFAGHTARIIGAAISPDGRSVLSGSDDGTTRLWDATTGKEIRRMTGHEGVVYGVCFGPKHQAMS